MKMRKAIALAVLAGFGCAGCKAPAKRSKAPDEPPAASVPAKAETKVDRPNVLLVTIDTLRADHLPMYGYRGVHTPHLDGLAKQGVVFERCSAHAPITLPSHASILTGLYPPEHGLRGNGRHYAREELNTLAESMTAGGYRTGAFVSAFVLDSRFGLDQGFSHYDDDLDDGRPKWSKFGVKDRRAETTVNRLQQWLAHEEQADKPFFAWLHLYDPHFEYDPPPPFKGRYPHPYDGEIAYTDHQLGRLFAWLKAEELFDDTLVVVTADHGESLGEHGESTHSLFIYEATQWVPLLIRFPGGKHGGKRVAGLSRHVDITPTLLDALGLEPPPGMSGRSLLASIAAGRTQVEQTYAEAYLPKDEFQWAPLFSIRTAAEKFILAPKSELYDLKLDPRELQNRFAASPAGAEGLRARLKALQQRMAPAEALSKKQAMDEETVAKLRALGYVSDVPADNSEEGRDPKDMLAVHEAREKAHRLMNDGAYPEALALLAKLLAADTNNATVHSDMASCHAELGDWAKAEAGYKAARKLAPDRVGSFTGLAKVYFKGLQDFAGAERELDAAFDIAPRDPGMWGLRGDLLHEQGRYPEAVNAYAKALEAGDQTPSYILGYASALNLTGKHKLARDQVERAIRMEPTNPVGHHNHGVILSKLGLAAAADGALREALRLQPSLIPSRTALASSLARRGREGEAVALLGEGLALTPDSRDILYELGSLHVAAKRYKKGIPLLQRAVKLAPRDPASLTNLAFAYGQSGQQDKAATQLQALSGLFAPGTNGYCDAQLRLARVRIAQAMKTEARAHLQAALGCDSKPVRHSVRSDPQLRALLSN